MYFIIALTLFLIDSASDMSLKYTFFFHLTLFVYLFIYLSIYLYILVCCCIVIACFLYLLIDQPKAAFSVFLSYFVFLLK